MRGSEWFQRFLTAKESARLAIQEGAGPSWYSRFLAAERAQRSFYARAVATRESRSADTEATGETQPQTTATAASEVKAEARAVAIEQAEARELRRGE